jgi:S-adenosylmethionine:tRNA-ribosyltransferase-isomerase (queuine synthetase)
VPIAIAVTPSLFYAVVPPLFILAPINALLALYIAAVTLVKSLERKTPPFILLTFVFLAVSLVTPFHAPASAVLRLLTAVMLALDVIYAEKEKKQA